MFSSMLGEPISCQINDTSAGHLCEITRESIKTMICWIRLSRVRAMSTGEPLSRVDVSPNDQRASIDVHSYASDDCLSKRFSLIDVTGSSQLYLGVFNHGTRIRGDLPSYSEAHFHCSRTRFMPTRQFNATVEDMTTPFDFVSSRDTAR